MVAESNCVAERRGGEQLEANNQPVNTIKLNSIRFESSASLLAKDEAREPVLSPIKGGSNERQIPGINSERGRRESSGMVGDRMVGRWSVVKWGTPAGKGSGVHGCSRPEEPRLEGVRVLGVAKKSRNGDGAKGDRKVEA